MSWFDDIFGGSEASYPGDSGSSYSSGGGGSSGISTDAWTNTPSYDFSSLPSMNYHSDNSMATPGNYFQGNFPSLNFHDDNPTGTPGIGGGGFNFMPSDLSVGSMSGALSPAYKLGGQAAPAAMAGFGMPGGQTQNSALGGGSVKVPGNPYGAGGGGGDEKGNAPQSLLDMLHAGTGNPKLDQQLLGGGVSGAGLLATLLMGNQQGDAQKKLGQLAGQQSAQGQQLASYLQEGKLPPGAQQWVDQQGAAKKAAIRSQYANMGLSGSTMEMQALNGVDEQATTQMFQIASSLLNTGITETGASGQLYNYLMNQENADSQEVSSAIQNFVSSIAGGGGGLGGKNVSLKLA